MESKQRNSAAFQVPTGYHVLQDNHLSLSNCSRAIEVSAKERTASIAVGAEGVAEGKMVLGTAALERHATLEPERSRYVLLFQVEALAS